MAESHEKKPGTPRMNIDAGTELTCTDVDCDCSLIVQNPCPHGDDYKCGCGAQLVPAADVPEKSESAEIG